ncbi:23S rRNA (uracil(747)-C(5))-methyltransferase RlmC [Nocardioides dokdonensis FR1436]|uniref:23S rRNA (Uracil(747)-C(5))-methyltransferase RlmC n=1 Tax=Nocardioides dokdonensis FR1436 TaxID=1300347 RepID=A0A1A9GJB0_9ACTN|nr:23S rRNA (uracil(747)-C(5))-methyltransferase RlmC [Nocardioides dokdonensis]ANH38379.1 23S rRNA (uracil(747)-C(5))-methyltransferase RlmC [Nocardioides dokdonensis FR1436]
MQCDYFDAGACRSCTWMGRAYSDQVAEKQRLVADLLAPALAGRGPARRAPLTWLPPVTGPEEGFRNKAKMVVAGTVDAPTLGILDPRGGGTDLRHCGLHEPGLHDALPVLAEHVSRARLAPYDVTTRRGELKHLLVTRAPGGELMVRWVLRSTEPEARLRKHLAWLCERLPVAVASVNIQPEHKAVLEGEREIVLTERATLPMELPMELPVDLPGGAGLRLHLRPQSFFQTNTLVATALYEQARAWAAEIGPASVWDLYGGVGGFALALAAPGRAVTGVEISPEAVASAQQSAAEAGLADARFVAADATAWALEQPAASHPDLVVVNPPRRGIGPQLTGWLESSEVGEVLYSSCNATTLARDLAALPSYDVVTARLLDMFPQTTHHEVLVRLRRR